ncbi:Alkali-sensitive linkage protein 1 [Cercospora beticola]|uniref:Alkali-sensitive linkage protein 1 n=1 Tax=Cercospora beticola TaxID=122368 RepID=A0A2G5HTI1_CERBT|nr:Alkali-sensitive linkage protein 1 [Cercospora beticola]PIA95840.1 Alkali-sensitive linkage protein 1 [Cercospora beticola]WPB07339.1 hypothetical protein RHO25_012000 [Cercospora beticola]CAK1367320.1 unnamed protein product [Cercospora beticola]
MEILSTLFAFLLLLGFSAARPYVSSSSSTTTTTCTTKLRTTTTRSTTTKCSTTASVKKYKSTTSSVPKAGGYHTKSATTSSKAGGYHPKSTSTSKAGGYAPKSSTTPSKAGGYLPKTTTTSSNAQYYGDKTSITTLTTSTSKAVYPDETSTSTTKSASSTSTSSETSTSATSSDVTTSTASSTTSSVGSTSSASSTSTVSSTYSVSTTSSTSTVSTTSSASFSTSSSTTASITTTTSSSITTSSSTSITSSTTTTAACKAIPTAGVGKRGLAYNYAAVTDLFATTTCPATSGTSKVTWTYNWYSAPQDPRLQETPRDLNPFVQFVPMLWSAHPDLTSVWFDNVAAAKEQGWTEILAFNEPDLCVEGAGASCMTVEEAVEAYRTYISPLKAQGFRLGGPAVTSSDTGKAWIRSFLQQCTGCNIDFIPIHWYGSPAQYGEFFSYLYEFYYGVVAEQYPIWVTEYGLTSGTADVVEKFMFDTMYEMDTQATFVEKYAWYMAGAPGVFPGNLVSGSALSDFGKIYDKAPGRRPPPP